MQCVWVEKRASLPHCLQQAEELTLLPCLGSVGALSLVVWVLENWPRPWGSTGELVLPLTSCNT